MFEIKDNELLNTKMVKRHKYLVNSIIKRKKSKVIITLILALSLMFSIRAYNIKTAKAQKEENVVNSVKLKNENKSYKIINPVTDKSGNRNYTFIYTAGDFKIIGKKSLGYDTLNINGIERKAVSITKNGNDYAIKYKKALITIENYYKDNRIDNICFSTDNRKKQSEVQQNLYKYLLNKANCDYLYKNAVKLNGGDKADTCVFFISEALRKQNEKIGRSVCYTGRYKSDIVHSGSLIYALLSDGWKINYNPDDLMPGDLCFTIDVKGKDGGYPTHVYTFMGWEKPNSTENAYIVDNQGYKYNGQFYHLRNVTSYEPKDKFHFFMYKPVE